MNCIFIPTTVKDGMQSDWLSALKCGVLLFWSLAVVFNIFANRSNLPGKFWKQMFYFIQVGDSTESTFDHSSVA